MRPFDGEKAMRYLETICELGPRPSGSDGMVRQQKLLTTHFTPLVAETGGRCGLQPFTAADPRDQSDRMYANFFVEWFPERRDRILLCAHYDTLPYPMRDPIDPKGVFVGANDGASGVAVLMTLGEEIASGTCEVPFGVDFVLFDAEEFRFRQEDPFFLGSIAFAERYRTGQIRTRNAGNEAPRNEKPEKNDEDPINHEGEPVVYHAAVLLDMVGDADLKIFQERNSLLWPEVRPIVRELWNVAERLNVREFVSRPRHQILDDHVALYEKGGIPACDVIDFDYGAWHTRADTPAQCSARSLERVGRVVREWLRTTGMVPTNRVRTLKGT
ncbi:MAG: M28 family peptidase [Planctomycetia bacterium]|nr:M28 family peptidase [Planctomycetia bacterium]